MSIQAFVKSLFSTHRQSIQRRLSTSRLCVESLEDRCLLSFSPFVDYGAGFNPFASLTAVDVNGDGRLDLAAANSVMLGNGDGTFQQVRIIPESGSVPLAPDLNGDGTDDLVTINNDNLDLRVYLGIDDGTYQPLQVVVLPSQLPPGAATYYTVQVPTSFAVGDLNADGKLDLIAMGRDEEIVSPGVTYRRDYYVNVLLGRGDGTFGQSAAYYVTSTTDGSYPYVAGVHDVNGDSKADVLIVGDAVKFFAGNGEGTLQTPLRDPGDSAQDVNADGKWDKVDLVYESVWSAFNEYVPDTIRSARVQLGNSDGSFAPPVISVLGTIRADATYESQLLADFDGNGFPDLVVREFRIQDGGYVYRGFSVALNNGIWTPPPPSIALGDATVAEGNTGTRAATFTVTLSAAHSQPVTVTYATANGTATTGSDYQVAAGTLTIPAGQTTGTITVLVKGDRLGEANEKFFVNLSSAINATVADGQAVGTILDDEPHISIGDVTKSEGKKGQTTLFTFTVTLSAPYDQAVTMSFRTVDGSAKMSDSDYIAKSGTLTFAPGETTKTITIEVKGDSKTEANETFYVDLFGNSGNSLFTKSRGIGTILNDD